MATDVAEPVVPDCRGDGRSGARSDADYPLRVLYCGGKSWNLPGCERSGSTHLSPCRKPLKPLAQKRLLSIRMIVRSGIC